LRSPQASFSGVVVVLVASNNGGWQKKLPVKRLPPDRDQQDIPRFDRDRLRRDVDQYLRRTRGEHEQLKASGRVMLAA
jgi:hypothetical protein